jgi:N-acetylmuramoyl-L-alanine amidase
LKIIINPGHWNTIGGQPDAGASGTVVDGARVMERDRTAVISRQVAALLPALGMEVELYPSLDGSSLPELDRIGSHARAEQVALLCAIHCDASPGTGGGRSGASAYYDQTKPGSMEIGATLSATIAATMGIPDLGSIPQYLTGVCGGNPGCSLSIHRQSRAGGGLPGILSILVECGYVDHPSDAAILQRHPELAAQGIVNGLKQYFNLSSGIIVPDPDYAVFADPTISPMLFRQALVNAGSPAFDEVDDLYQIATDNGVNPAVALAFFALESNYGAAPGAASRKNWGNLSANGQLKTYTSWAAGLREWGNHFRTPAYANAPTISKIVPIYQPSSAGGTVDGYNRYITRLHDLIKGWADQLAAQGGVFAPQ